MSGLLSSLLGLGGGAALLTGAYNRLGDVGDQAWERGQVIANDTADRAQFVPFGVTSSSGSANVNQQGGVNLQLSPGQQALQDQLSSGASSLFSQVLGGSADREQEIYGRIRAMQMPEEQRQRMALEERLMNQGRLGVRTNQYGGTPEQLALAKAQEEAQNTASFQAIELARAQQAQNATIGNSMLQGQYAPEAQLLNVLGSGMQGASLADAARRQSANLYGQGMFAGLESQLVAAQAQGNLMGNLGTGLLSGVLSPISTAGGGLTTLLGDALGI